MSLLSPFIFKDEDQQENISAAILAVERAAVTIVSVAAVASTPMGLAEERARLGTSSSKRSSS